jgi:hypothetical protein
MMSGDRFPAIDGRFRAWADDGGHAHVRWGQSP